MQDRENNYWVLFDGGMTSAEVPHPGWETALQHGINKWGKFRDVWQNDTRFQNNLQCFYFVMKRKLRKGQGTWENSVSLKSKQTAIKRWLFNPTEIRTRCNWMELPQGTFRIWKTLLIARILQHPNRLPQDVTKPLYNWYLQLHWASKKISVHLTQFQGAHR